MKNLRQLFKNVDTQENLKKLYLKLSKEHHPDMGGDLRVMQDVNSLYTEFKSLLKESKQEKNGVFEDIIDKIMTFSDVTVEIIGNWVWVSGDTKKYKENLKELGFWYSGKHKKWYHTMGVEPKRYSSGKSFVNIRETYGSEIIKQG